MASPVPRNLPSLLSQLSRAIGRESAQTELKWMRQTLKSPPSGIAPSARTLQEMVARRVAGEPLQYILGSQPFGSLNLAVRPPVLIPRPETEDWTIRLAETLTPSPDRPFSMLDLCTGTGCIPLLLCHLWPPGSVHATGIDISDAAIQLATDNAILCGLRTSTSRSPDDSALPQRQNNLQSSIRLGSDHRSNTTTTNTFTPILADLMHPEFTKHARLRPPYDLITSNPPYIPRAEYDTLPPSVRDYEDVRALLGDPADASLSYPTSPPNLPSTSTLTPSRSIAAATSGVAHPGSASEPHPESKSESYRTQDRDQDQAMPASHRSKGLTFYHRIAALVHAHGLLRAAGGTLALEVGDGQAADVVAIVEHRARLRAIDVWKDPWGKERVVVARR